MKRLVCMLLVLAMLCSLSAAAFAAPPGHHDKHPPGPSQHQERHYQHRDNDPGPLRWHQHRREFEGHHMRAIHDRQLEHRYHGLRGYRWQGHGDGHRGFWHNNHYVNDGIIFFDREDRMAGFGYMANGVFIFVEENGHREDRESMFFFILLFKLLESLD